MIRLSDILMILYDCDIHVSNVMSNNIIYENNEVKLVDLCLNELRSSENMVIDEICYRSPEELSGSESNEKSVIWSVGCILYEILNKKLPFNEENDVLKTLNNILKCKLNDDIKVDDENVKKILDGILEVENEDRLSLLELNKEMIKENEISKDLENNLMIIEERKEMLFDNDYSIEISAFDIQLKYYFKSEKLEAIRDDLIGKYNNKPNERILSILLMMKLYKIDKSAQDKLKFQIHHQCKYLQEEYCLDEMIFPIDFDYEKIDTIEIDSDYICVCEEGMKYFFRIMKLINPTKLLFRIILIIFIYIDDYDGLFIPIQSQPLFGLCFSQLSNLQELDLSEGDLAFYFMESFVISIPSMIKLKYVNLHCNPIGPIGFKLLLQYLHLLINNRNELDLNGMRLNDESMILLSSELYKYPNIEKIDVRYNNNIHPIGLKSLFSKFPISRIKFDFSVINKDLLIKKDIPELVKYIKSGFYNNELDLSNLEIDNSFFKSFISLRLDELIEIRKLDLSNNKLTSESVEILINNLSSLPNLKELQLNGNPIGDVGMKILYPHLLLLKMELSSDGLKYLLDGLKNIHEEIRLDIGENNIDSSGIEYLMKYMKENDNIEKIFIHNNPIGNDGFKILLNNLNMMIRGSYPYEMNLNNISIDDESVTLLTNKLDSIRECKTVNLSENNIKIKGLKSICKKSLEKEEYPFIKMKSSNWRNEELKYYLDYCIKKKERNDYDFSNMNLNDSHISLIKQIDYRKLDLSNNQISFKGLKELTDSLPKDSEYISIYGNEIGDEPVEIIFKNIDKFVDNSSLNLSDIGMSEKGLKMLIERLTDYKPFRKIDISGTELNEEELRLMKENEEVFYYLDELSITIKENINRNELKSFLETFSTIGTIKLNGINEEEKRELSKEFFNIQ